MLPKFRHQADPFEHRAHFSCAKCYKVFKPSKNFQLYCSDECEKIMEAQLHELKEKKLNGICQSCGLKIRNVNENTSRSFCYPCTRQKAKARYIPVPEAEKKPRYVFKNKKSYEQLIREQERERVFKDSGWTHYLKGRKWDRI